MFLFGRTKRGIKDYNSGSGLIFVVQNQLPTNQIIRLCGLCGAHNLHNPISRRIITLSALTGRFSPFACLQVRTRLCRRKIARISLFLTLFEMLSKQYHHIEQILFLIWRLEEQQSHVNSMNTLMALGDFG